MPKMLCKMTVDVFIDFILCIFCIYLYSSLLCNYVATITTGNDKQRIKKCFFYNVDLLMRAVKTALCSY